MTLTGRLTRLSIPTKAVPYWRAEVVRTEDEAADPFSPAVTIRLDPQWAEDAMRLHGGVALSYGANVQFRGEVEPYGGALAHYRATATPWWGPAAEVSDGI